MSEQTPNSSEDLSGAEPSMEDILASIRKIISDDEPVALESPEDIPTASLVEDGSLDDVDSLMQETQFDSNDLTSDAVADVTALPDGLSVSDAESVDLDIEDVLAGLDGDILGSDVGMPSIDDPLSSSSAESVESLSVLGGAGLEHADSAVSPVESQTADEFVETALETDEDILSLLDVDIALASETEALGSGVLPDAHLPEIPNEAPEKISSGDDAEMDALLDDILMTTDDASVETLDEDVFNGVDASIEAPGVEDSSDLELVKSLMADLADDPEGLESGEDLDALLAIPEVEEVPEVESGSDVEASEIETAAEGEEDILGDILDMTLEDELSSHPDDIVSSDDVAAAEQENIVANAVEENGAQDDDLPSLSEIAAAAEADAAAVETAIAPQAVAATAGLGAVAGIAALGATTLGASPAETETETAVTYSEPSPEPTPTQETSMPAQAVKSDAILDEVTETATAGAFAELNQVVEDKAIFNERGPRIGDLVQEALRPMLKEWLDANLKSIVERAVAKEVKRISSGK